MKAVYMNKINYQLQLDKILDNLQKKQEIPHCCCTAAALRAAAMYWNIYQIIFRLQCFIIIRIFHLPGNTSSGCGNRSVSLKKWHFAIQCIFRKEITSQNGFMRWPGEWSICQKAKSGVMPVTDCGWVRLQNQGQQGDTTILPLR